VVLARNPDASPTVDHYLTEGGRRKQPDRMSRYGEKRLDKARQQSEPLYYDPVDWSASVLACMAVTETVALQSINQLAALA
jgi:hypothetical protein